MRVETTAGCTFLVDRASMFNEPKLIIRRFPVLWSENVLTDGPAHTVMEGVWADQHGVRFNVGDVLPPESEKIPRPGGRYKGRVVRYRFGQWEFQRKNGRWEIPI